MLTDHQRTLIIINIFLIIIIIFFIIMGICGAYY